MYKYQLKLFIILLFLKNIKKSNLKLLTLNKEHRVALSFEISFLEALIRPLIDSICDISLFLTFIISGALKTNILSFAKYESDNLSILSSLSFSGLSFCGSTKRPCILLVPKTNFFVRLSNSKKLQRICLWKKSFFMVDIKYLTFNIRISFQTQVFYKLFI